MSHSFVSRISDVKERFDPTDFNKSLPTSRVLSLPLLSSLIRD